MFDSVLIANRGEIARRIIRTLHRLGVRAIVVYEGADRRAPHVAEADLAVPVTSYLDVDAVIAACRESGAQALHPGYGFLSENPTLPRACAAGGIVFIGPPAEAVEAMGDKIRAKELARESGVPTVPSFTLEQARTGDEFPLLVKAAAGGGGRGMRVVTRVEELDAAITAARREAQAGFGDDRVFIERFIERARHLEVQILGDGHGTIVHLGERECSLQRRHQKVMEEAPSPAVSPELRRTLGCESVALAQAAGYVNAGTVEFIADAADPSRHYFLEMNARLQVEHPVTEMVTGLDLVELQLRVAAGEPLGLVQEDIVLTGHAIEVRITAEDATRDFLPATGRILAYDRPGPSQARVDDGIEVGSIVDTSYDSLLAKIIVHAGDRPAAIGRLERALAHTTILGVTTTTGFLRALLADDAVRVGRLDTGLIGRGAGLTPPMSDADAALAAAMLILADARSDDDDPFATTDGWRLNGARASSYWRLAVGGGDPVSVEVVPEHAAMVHPLGGGRFGIDERGEWLLRRDGEIVWIGHSGWTWAVRATSSTIAAQAGSDGDLRAPMPGQVLVIHARVGDTVTAGDPIIVLESMKMELVLTAPLHGHLAELTVDIGDRVTVDQPLARVEGSS